MCDINDSRIIPEDINTKEMYKKNEEGLIFEVEHYGWASRPGL